MTLAHTDTERAATRFARDHLKSFVERIERLTEEKKSIADDIRDVYAEAKANGFDVKALRQIVKLRAMDQDERREQETVLETYMHALGMLSFDPEPRGGGSGSGAGGSSPSGKNGAGNGSQPDQSSQHRPVDGAAAVEKAGAHTTAPAATSEVRSDCDPASARHEPAASDETRDIGADPGDLPAFLRIGDPACDTWRKPRGPSDVRATGPP